jgi:hypothetical protein
MAFPIHCATVFVSSVRFNRRPLSCPFEKHDEKTAVLLRAEGAYIQCIAPIPRTCARTKRAGKARFRAFSTGPNGVRRHRRATIAYSARPFGSVVVKSGQRHRKITESKHEITLPQGGTWKIHKKCRANNRSEIDLPPSQVEFRLPRRAGANAGLDCSCAEFRRSILFSECNMQITTEIKFG